MSKINQKEYLKKYLSIGSKSSKKKNHKKRAPETQSRVKIIDDDIDVNLFNQAVEEDMSGANEDAPQIVGVIDERPPELRIDDYRKSDKWKPLGAIIEIKEEEKSENEQENNDQSPIRRKRNDSDQDLSPPRINDDSSPPRRNRNRDLSPKRSRSRWDRNEKTLDGKKSGLQSAKEVMKELEDLKRSEEEKFGKISKEVSGATAKTVFRDRKTGKVRNFEEEATEKRKKQEKEDERNEKYTRWGRGLKQVEDYQKKVNEDLHEMSKPLARYADDEDLERYLKEQERAGDPMLEYLRKKRRKDDGGGNKASKPLFEGEFMPNRYGIRPGHRWDGVDRSNGYEKKWIGRVNAESAQQEEIYKWSTEDM
nr:BUD13 homolog isoform X1 [Onthophagus taurus]